MSVKIILSSMIGLFAVWFLLVGALIRVLRRDSPSLFKELGEPSLFVDNSPRNSWRLARYMLFARLHEKSNIASLCIAIRILLSVATVLFIFLMLHSIRR